MRTVNAQLLTDWRQAKGEQAYMWLADRVRCSYWTIMRIRKGHVPLRRIREDLSRAIGCREDQLFPLTDDGQSTRPTN